MDFYILDGYLKSQQGRIIHQIWFGTIPNKHKARKTFKKYENYQRSWIEQNPTWQYKLWNKDECVELINHFYPEFMTLFKRYKYEIQRCDAIRYFILHRYGGLYADMDTECLKPFDDALKAYPKDIYLVETANTIKLVTSGVSNMIMFSRNPGHMFWKMASMELLSTEEQPWYFTRHMRIMYSTGPSFISRLYNRYKFRWKIGSFPKEYFNPIQLGSNYLDIDRKKLFTIHYYAASWNGKDSNMLVFLYEYCYIILFIILVMIVPHLIF